jgi:hypothetical protein
MSEPALPIALPHLRTSLLDDLLLRTWKSPLTVKREDGFLVSFMFADYLLHWTSRPFGKMRARWVVGKQSRSVRRLFKNAPSLGHHLQSAKANHISG